MMEWAMGMLEARAIRVAMAALAVALLVGGGQAGFGSANAPGAAQPPRRVVYFVATDNDRERGDRNFLEFTLAVERTPGIDLTKVSLELVNVIGLETDAATMALDALSRNPPDVIIATSQGVLEAVSRMSLHVPVLFLSHPDPVELGDVKSLAAPGVNRTGFTFFSPVTAKHLELLHDAFPKVRRVGVIVDDYLMHAKWFTEDLRLARTSLVLEVSMFRATDIVELRRLLATLHPDRVDAWYVPISQIMGKDYDEVVRSLRELHKPVVYSRVLAVEKGGTLAYEARLEDSFGIWARQLRLILAGVPAATIPIEQPQSFEIAVNLDGSNEYPALRPSKAILKRATRIFGGGVN
jgi:putative tryptophan/tyrosine transport system substrate-binding protein